MELTYKRFFVKIIYSMERFDEKGVFLITDRVTRRYFLSADVAEGVLLSGRKSVFFTDARYFYAAKAAIAKSSPDTECRLYGGLNDVAAAIKEDRADTLYLDYDKTTMSEYAKYKGFGLPVKDGSAFLKNKRLIKTEAEIDCIRRACDIIEKAYYAILPLVKEGVTEKELAAALEKECLRLGADEMSFDTIVAFGANSAVPHHVTGDARLKRNSPVLIDCGCKVNGYCSDLTRTAFFGNPSDKFLSAYDAVLNANLKAEDEIFSGCGLIQADGIARSYLSERGYGPYFTHSLGHGVGLEIHESPTLSPRAEGVLLTGEVFTIEPGVYFDGEFGIRIEDTVLLTNGGVSRLFTDNKNLIVL